MNQELILIKKFLDNSLNSVESKIFYKNLEKDSFVDLITSETIRLASKNHLFEFLKTSEIQVQSQKKIKCTWGGLLVIFLLSLTTICFYNADKKPSNSDELFATYFKPYPMVLHKRSDSNLRNQDFLLGITHYDRGEFSSASKFLSQNESLDSNYQIYSAFYRSLSLMALDRIQSALPILDSLRNENSTLSPEANWYYTLCLIKEKKLKKAEENLSDLKNANLASMNLRILSLLKDLENLQNSEYNS